MRLVTRIWFWLLVILLLVVGSAVVASGLVATADRVLGGTAFNVWGDMEGLIVPMWVLAAVLFVGGLVGLLVFLTRWPRTGGSAQQAHPAERH
jgi:uncharacterized membrane protein